jgi:hypothetical protein
MSGNIGSVGFTVMQSRPINLKQALSSPANLAVGALVALLVIGYASDWKILFGNNRPKNNSIRFGTTERSIGSRHTQYLRQEVTAKHESAPEVAEND